MNISGDFLRSGEVQETSGAAQASEAANQSSAGSASVSSSQEQADKASLSTAGAAASVASSSEPESEVRSGKVATIQAALVTGNYQVSSTDVANTVINYMLSSSPGALERSGGNG
ncbi:flagellar biosynthesis anti-sigma factor FlgM [Silvibacterium sp.]|uniref:flagellar biosynthesis anti-sigma factor FlgM n=1 Tax=Silvibacterium sp. TaxID=1964179 RepID=UPI0039E3C1BA